MKKLLFIVILSCLAHKAQSMTDTLEVSKRYKTILIFPENIAESIIGNDFGFVVDLPNPNGSKYNGRILKLYYDELGKENSNFTNHTVITDSGNVYDFILKLTDIPEKLTWYIGPEMALKNIDKNQSVPRISEQTDTLQLETTGPIAKEPTSALIQTTKLDRESATKLATKELYENDPMEYYRLRCYYMQFDKAKVGRYFSRADNLFLWLKGVYYNEEELYFQFKIENKEGLNMDVNFFKYSLASNYRNSSSNQRLEVKPIFLYKQPRTVEGKSENHFVVVFKKLALDENTELMVELDEESGNRNLSLAIGHHIVNNPIHFE